MGARHGRGRRRSENRRADGEQRLPPYSDAQNMRIVSVVFRVGDRSRGRFALVSLYTVVARTEGYYTHDARVREMCLVQGLLSVAPWPDLNVRRNVASSTFSLHDALTYRS